MNTADEIIAARAKFACKYVGVEPQIAINPHLFRRFLGMRDQNGVHYVYVDPFDRSKWALLGMRISVNSEIDHWEIFGVMRDRVTYREDRILR